jgi:hypothetical protein
MRRQGRGIDARWEHMEYKSSAFSWRILGFGLKESNANELKGCLQQLQYTYTSLHPGNNKNEDVRVPNGTMTSLTRMSEWLRRGI